MPLLSTSLIRDWHAHVYFDATTRDAARSLRETIATALADRVAVGRFHEKPVGPHPMGSFQLVFDVGAVAEVVGWLALNRDGLDVLVHPNTGDALRDHRDATCGWGDRIGWSCRALTTDARSSRPRTRRAGGPRPG